MMGDLVRRNRDETAVIAIFHLALLVIILVPVMGIVMLFHAEQRLDWRFGGGSDSALTSVSWSISSGDGSMNLVLVEPSAIDAVPLSGSKQLKDCAVGSGVAAPQQFKDYAATYGCSAQLADSAVIDDRNVTVVQIGELPDDLVNDLTQEPESMLNVWLLHIAQVYFVVVIVPCLVCFWNVSRIFDAKWMESASILALRGADTRTAATLLSYVPSVGLLIGWLGSVLPLFWLSTLLKDVVWDGQAFITQDAQVAFMAAVGCGLVLTLISSLVLYMRRREIVVHAK